ncbi:ATP-binding protein [Tenggerimyces flavus]|uniref:ATP-binding protein n=1 Tax=Tenggerimyces flavus TaxID=1708749 RepID=A0ABV7YMR8_9ACTN|nr:ATP-binding protein [Tenggerimyces flavus]MBM7789541.1 hypothetical protein [Tenggerimyces flavus]
MLEGFQFHRLDSTPRLDVAPDWTESNRDQTDRVPAQLFAALTAAHAELTSLDVPGAAVAVAWDRLPGSRSIRVLTGGRPHFPSAPAVPGDGLEPVLYPPGSLGERVDTPTLGQQWEQFPVWLRCSGRSDPLWTPDSGATEKPPSRGGFEDYVAHVSEGFVWLVVAEPLTAEDVDKDLLGLETQIPRLRQRENSEPDRIALLRAEARYRELSRAMASGMWNVHILVGGVSLASARRAAGLLCSASDLDELPYALTPSSAASGTLAEVWQGRVDDERDAFASPFPAAGELVAALARPPRRELPGIRIIEPPSFDVTPEHEGTVHLGAVLDEADLPVGEFSVELDTLNRHAFVAGATGSGKSQTVRHVLEGLSARKIPWLVIEPAKAEYALMAGRLGPAGKVLRIRPGAPNNLPVGLNPLQPEPGFPLQTHIDLTGALFMAAFDAQEPFPQVLAHALNRCYADLGWDAVTGDVHTVGGSAKYPTLGDLQRVALDVVEGIGYGKEVASNVRGFIDVRLTSLRLGTPGRFFEGGHVLNFAALLEQNTVLEIEDIGSDTDKAFFIGAILIRLFEHLRVRSAASPASGLRHVTVIEEAHRLLKRVEEGSPTAHAVELFTSLLAEIRAYGEGIVVAEQIPSKIVPDVIKNTALKVLHRLPALDDREAVGATMNLDEAQSRHVVTLPPGRAAIFADGMDRPIRLAMPNRLAAESSVDASIKAPILSTRSVACGPVCVESPCTLRQLNSALRSSDDAQLTLWIELLAIAHLAGQPAPVPSASWLAGLVGRLDRRTLECALAHRVQAAIDTRYTGLAGYYAPESLAAHLAASALAVIDGLPLSCDGSEIAWQAGRYRWIDVLHTLRPRPGDSDERHPLSDSWAARGLDLPGATRSEQWAALKVHPDNYLPARSIVLGTETPPLWAAAVARLSHLSDPVERFAQAASFLDLRVPWAPTVLGLDAS